MSCESVLFSKHDQVQASTLLISMILLGYETTTNQRRYAFSLKKVASESRRSYIEQVRLQRVDTDTNINSLQPDTICCMRLKNAIAADELQTVDNFRILSNGREGEVSGTSRSGVKDGGKCGSWCFGMSNGCQYWIATHTWPKYRQTSRWIHVSYVVVHSIWHVSVMI